MATIKEYLDYAELAQASYSGFTEGMFGKDNKLYMDALMEDNKAEFSQTQAENFANRYEVKAIADPLLTGLDATLFYDTKNHKYVLSIRGTSSVADIFANMLLATKGVAYDQLAALNSFYDQWILDGTIPIGAQIDVTGHSLGGALAQVFAAQHPNGVANAYSYNAPGIGGLSAEAYEILGITPANIAASNITNVYVKEGIEVAAGLGTMIGDVVAVSVDEGILTQNHSIPRLTESLHIYDMLSSITQTQDIELLTSILEHTTNEKAISIVSDIFNYEVSGSDVDKAIDLTKKWSGDAVGIVSLVDKTPEQLQSKTPENLYALSNLNPFIIEGDYLPAYSTLKADDYSQTYLQKRSEMLYYTIHPQSANTGNGTLYQDVTTGAQTQDKPNTSILATGSLVKFGGEGNDDLVGFDNDDYLFGGDGDDTLVGQGGNDYLEGGKGNDTYIADNGDTLMDSDHQGKVYLAGILLTGGKVLEGETNQYKGDNGEIYTLDTVHNTLHVSHEDKEITINNYDYNKQSLGIILLENKDIEVSITESASTREGDTGTKSLYFTVTLSRVLEEGETLEVSVSNTDEGTYTFTSGEQSKTFTHSWSGDTQDEGAIDHRATLTPSASYEGPYDAVKVVIKNSGTAIVYDDDNILPDIDGGGNEDFSSPLVLDLNGNKITSTFLTDSQTYFDTDNDGFKQFQAFTLTNLLTCKDFQSNKSLHVRTKIKQKGATYGAGQRAA